MKKLLSKSTDNGFLLKTTADDAETSFSMAPQDMSLRGFFRDTIFQRNFLYCIGQF
jgi:hypothetical protein